MRVPLVWFKIGRLQNAGNFYLSAIWSQFKSLAVSLLHFLLLKLVWKSWSDVIGVEYWEHEERRVFQIEFSVKIYLICILDLQKIQKDFFVMINFNMVRERAEVIVDDQLIEYLLLFIISWTMSPTTQQVYNELYSQFNWQPFHSCKRGSLPLQCYCNPQQYLSSLSRMINE